jgi:hypothetical protein
MNRRTVWSLALAILVAAGLATEASARTFVPTPNLSGTWRLEQGSNGKYWHGERDFGRGNERGQGVGLGDVTLPRAFQIVQGPNRLRVTNRRGEVVQVILLDDHFGFNGRGGFGDSRFRNRNQSQNDRDVLIGQWHGPVLEAEQMGPRGTQMTQTFRLANRGRTLVVRTEVARGRSGATMQIEQIYERA